MHESGNQPVSYQNDWHDGHFGPKLPARGGEDEGSKHPGQADASQHAGEPLCLEIELKQSAIDHAQEHQQQAAPQDFQVDACHGLSSLHLFLQREGEGDARDEEEQREDGVVVAESVPLDMLHLLGQGLGQAARKPLCQCNEQACAAHDEQHVEAAKGIDGGKAKPLSLFLERSLL